MASKSRPYFFEGKAIRVIDMGRIMHGEPQLSDNTFWASKNLRHNPKNDNFKFKGSFKEWLHANAPGQFEVVRVHWRSKHTNPQYRFAIEFKTDLAAVLFKMFHG